VFTRTAWFAVGFAVLLFASYMFYTPFEHWTYLRFLLPASPLLFVVAVPALDRLFGRWERARALAFAAIVSTLAVAYVHTAVRGDAFALKRSWQTRYEDTARFAMQRFPQRAAFVSLLQSGSLRFYADRLTIRYDVLEPQALPQVGPFLRAQGYDPYVALDVTELPDFQKRFGAFYRAP
jgi:hypothetical protein